MKVYRRLEDFKKLDNAVVTSGMFDGVHLGHKKVISRLLEVSQNCGGESVVITFWPHPRMVLNADDCSDLKLLSTIGEKMDLFGELGVHHFLVIPFTRAFSELTSDAFIRSGLVEAIGTENLVIGYDHRVARSREGRFEFRCRNAPVYGFDVVETASEDIARRAIRSSRIRDALLSCPTEHANHLLGYEYALSG